MTRMDEIKPKLKGDCINNFTTPTLEELPAEYRLAYEALKKHEEEYLQQYVKCLPPCSNHVDPSVMLRQDKKETLQTNQKKQIHSASTVDPVETKSNITKSSIAKSNNSFKAKTMKDSDETKLSTGMVKAKCTESRPSASSQLRPSATSQMCNRMDPCISRVHGSIRLHRRLMPSASSQLLLGVPK